MLIKSDFRDYYDGAMSTGVDMSLAKNKEPD